LREATGDLPPATAPICASRTFTARSGASSQAIFGRDSTAFAPIKAVHER